MLNETEKRVRVEVEDDTGAKEVTDTWVLQLGWFGLIVHRHFNEEPYHLNELPILRSKDGRQAFIDDGILKKPIDNFLERIMLKHDTPEFYDFIKQLVYVWHNQLHNYMAIKSETAVVSARAMDVVHIYRHPKIADLKQRVMNRETNLADAGKEFEDIMMTDPAFDRSVFGLLYRTRSVSTVQSFQLIIARGDVFDLNNVILPNTVMTSYADGITNLADSLGDSKGAGFSLISNGAALQDSEWFHRKVHNLAQVVRGVRYQTDCGSTTGPVIKIVSKDFKKCLAGSYRINDDGTTTLLTYKVLEEIKTGDVIRIRNVAWCKDSHQGKPCSICFGKMESALPYNPYTKKSAVPGIFYGSTFAEPIGQSILKTKHRIGTASAKGFEVNKQDKDYISTDKKGDYIYFNEKILNDDSDPYLILDKRTQQDFSDFKFMDSLEDLNPNMLSTYETVDLKVNTVNPMLDEGKATYYPKLVTNIASRKARMTRPFIEHLLSQPMERYDGNKFKISIKGFDHNEPAYELPLVNEDLDAYRERVESFLRFKDWGDTEVTPEVHGETLIAFWKVVDEKYKEANIVMHSIFLWCCMVTNPKELDFSIPTGEEPRQFMNFQRALLSRGLGNAIMYGWQKDVLMGGPLSFLIKNRQGGALECFIHPMARG